MSWDGYADSSKLQECSKQKVGWMTRHQIDGAHWHRGLITRRRFLQATGFLAASASLGFGKASVASHNDGYTNAGVEYGKHTLRPGIRSRRIDTNNQVVLHVLESGFEAPEG